MGAAGVEPARLTGRIRGVHRSPFKVPDEHCHSATRPKTAPEGAGPDGGLDYCCPFPGQFSQALYGFPVAGLMGGWPAGVACWGAGLVWIVTGSAGAAAYAM